VQQIQHPGRRVAECGWGRRAEEEIRVGRRAEEEIRVGGGGHRDEENHGPL
jgi:hypothetical protein